MTDALLKEILEGISNLNKRIDNLEWLIMDLKIPLVDPTPEEQKIIEEYEKDKEKGVLEFSKFV